MSNSRKERVEKDVGRHLAGIAMQFPLGFKSSLGNSASRCQITKRGNSLCRNTTTIPIPTEMIQASGRLFEFVLSRAEKETFSILFATAIALNVVFTRENGISPHVSGSKFRQLNM